MKKVEKIQKKLKKQPYAEFEEDDSVKGNSVSEDSEDRDEPSGGEESLGLELDNEDKREEKEEDEDKDVYGRKNIK